MSVSDVVSVVDVISKVVTTLFQLHTENQEQSFVKERLQFNLLAVKALVERYEDSSLTLANEKNLSAEKQLVLKIKEYLLTWNDPEKLKKVISSPLSRVFSQKKGAEDSLMTQLDRFKEDLESLSTISSGKSEANREYFSDMNIAFPIWKIAAENGDHVGVNILMPIFQKWSKLALNFELEKKDITFILKIIDRNADGVISKLEFALFVSLFPLVKDLSKEDKADSNESGPSFKYLLQLFRDNVFFANCPEDFSYVADRARLEQKKYFFMKWSQNPGSFLTIVWCDGKADPEKAEQSEDLEVILKFHSIKFRGQPYSSLAALAASGVLGDPCPAPDRDKFKTKYLPVITLQGKNPERSVYSRHVYIERKSLTNNYQFPALVDFIAETKKLAVYLTEEDFNSKNSLPFETVDLTRISRPSLKLVPEGKLSRSLVFGVVEDKDVAEYTVSIASKITLLCWKELIQRLVWPHLPSQ